MQFRANRELFKFIPINEQVEGDKLTKIASNIALAAVEAGAVNRAGEHDCVHIPGFDTEHTVPFGTALVVV